MTTPTLLEIGDLQIGYYSQISPEKDKINGDALLVAIDPSNGEGIIAVADGAGGTPKGDEASGIALEELKKLIKAFNEESSRYPVLDWIDHMNQKLLDQKTGGLTTLCLAHLFDADSVRNYQCGDSSMLVLGQRGKRKYRSIAHSPVGHRIEAGVLEEDEALAEEDLFSVTNLLGTGETRVDVGPILKLSKYDRIVMMSDGLTDNLLLSEITSLSLEPKIDDALNKLKALAEIRMTEINKEIGKPDDLSVLICQFARKSI